MINSSYSYVRHRGAWVPASLTIQYSFFFSTRMSDQRYHQLLPDTVRITTFMSSVVLWDYYAQLSLRDQSPTSLLCNGGLGTAAGMIMSLLSHGVLGYTVLTSLAVFFLWSWRNSRRAIHPASVPLSDIMDRSSWGFFTTTTSSCFKNPL